MKLDLFKFSMNWSYFSKCARSSILDRSLVTTDIIWVVKKNSKSSTILQTIYGNIYHYTKINVFQ